jgi:CDP-diglyceride synthetase
MKMGPIISITLLVIIIALWEWPRMNGNPKKDKVAALSILALGWLLSILFVQFPDIPYPDQVIQAMLKPLSGILKK